MWNTCVKTSLMPVDYVDAFKEAGVDEFIHVKSNVYETLFNLMKSIGVM